MGMYLKKYQLLNFNEFFSHFSLFFVIVFNEDSRTYLPKIVKMFCSHLFSLDLPSKCSFSLKQTENLRRRRRQGGKGKERRRERGGGEGERERMAKPRRSASVATIPHHYGSASSPASASSVAASGSALVKKEKVCCL